MNKMMGLLAPRTAIGFCLRFLFLIALMAFANGLFHYAVDDHTSDYIGYNFLHALFVSGPLVAFFLIVTYFQIQLQKKLWLLSREDGLTGLHNRRTFFDVTTSVRVGKKEGVLMMLDADKFKEINDTYGHQAGDACLKSIAYTIKRNVRRSDVVGRIGGEEFAIYLHDTSPREARAIGERLVKPISFKTEATGPLTVTLSIGAATTHPESSIDDIFAFADHALYQAKRKGRARMVIFEDGQNLPSAGAAT